MGLVNNIPIHSLYKCQCVCQYNLIVVQSDYTGTPSPTQCVMYYCHQAHNFMHNVPMPSEIIFMHTPLCAGLAQTYLQNAQRDKEEMI